MTEEVKYFTSLASGRKNMKYIYTCHVFNNYPAKSRRISTDT